MQWLLIQSLFLWASFYVKASLSAELNNDVNKPLYNATWDSLDSRPLPQWYDDAKIGIFIHWGVFSVPSYGSEWFWANWKGNNSGYNEFMKKNYPPGFTYQDFARDFTAQFYNASEWADLFAASGAKYVVLTSKHHEGYTLWPSKYSFSWNSQDVGPHRDLVGELAAAIRANTTMKFGLYHSLFEWFHPLYLEDKKNFFSTHKFVRAKTMPELHELVENYRPDLIWSDGDWEALEHYWDSKKFLAWLYNDSPVKDTVVVNDRWGFGTSCRHGGYFTCIDHFNPGFLLSHKWENAMTIEKYSWGYRRNAKLSDYVTVKELVTELAQTVSCGGNLLMNIGPTKDGIISPIFEDRLRGLGSWLAVNGEAIYGSRAWTHQKDFLTSGVWYTKSGKNAKEKYVYAVVLDWPLSNKLRLSSVKLTKNSTINLLGCKQDLTWSSSRIGIDIIFPDKARVKTEWAWVLRFSKVKN